MARARKGPAGAAPADTKTRARPAAIENVGRFITDSLLAPGALEDFFRGDVARPAEVRDAFDRCRRLWKRVAYRAVGEGAAPGVTRQAWTLPLFEILGHRPRAGEELDAERGAVRDLWVARAADDTAPRVVYDFLGFSDGLDAAVKGAETRRTRHERLEDLVAQLDIPWGVLASGREIRLVRKDTSGEPRFLQFHVESILEEEDHDAFWVLFQLLRWTAFIEVEGRAPLLTRAIEESDKIGTGVSRALGESARFALETFLRELYRDPANQPFLENELARPGQLEELHREGLLFLYRLLFVFFAESRKLLPLENPLYFDSYSLEAWRDKLYDADQFSGGDYYLWGSLAGLFALIEGGFDAPAIRIPPYNGGLFSRQRTPMIARCRLNDRALRDVLFSLSTAKVGRTKKDQKLDRVSYRELGVEQLGSVYEGLLEFEPKLALEDMVVVPLGSGKKASAQVMPRRELARVKSAAAADPDALESIPKGTLYLSAWGGRRKGSGSYYTPSVITRFLVQQALEPLVEPILARCATRDGNNQPQGHPDEILRLRVIDPAMGSGAFLVAATHYLAEQYGRAHIAAGLDEAGQLGDTERSFYRRRVVEHCIYGVDLNPLAVELAKVSLWLTTLAADRPLTFLDHHLRCGNSLIGAPIRELEVERARGQKTVRTKVWIDRVPEEALAAVGKSATKADKERAKERIALNRRTLDHLEQGMIEFGDINQKVLEKRLDEYLSTRGLLEQDTDELPLAEALKLIHEKERLLNEAYQRPESGARRLKVLADLWCAIWFWPDDPGNPPPHTGELRQVAGRLLTELLHADTDRVEQILETAREIARAQRFFHWELEFPEVYRTPGGGWVDNPGFDAVVGNPPWEVIQPNANEFLAATDSSVSLGERTAVARIGHLIGSDSKRSKSWNYYTDSIAQLSRWLKSGVQFHRQGAGKLDYYRLFTEKAWALVRSSGSVGLLTSSAFGTDAWATQLRELVLEKCRIQYWFTLSNERFLFPGVHHAYRFTMIGFRKGQPTRDFLFLSRLSPQEALDLAGCESLASVPQRSALRIDADLIRKIAPESLAVMAFRNSRDVTIVTAIVENSVPLREVAHNEGIIKFGVEFDLTADRHLFSTRDALRALECVRVQNEAFSGKDEKLFLPLFEGKHLNQFTRTSVPFQYWIEAEAGDAALCKSSSAGGRTRRRVVWRGVTSSSNERTMIASIVPKDHFLGNSLFWALPPARYETFVCALMNSLVFDYVARFRVSQNALYGLVAALPAPRLGDHEISLAQVDNLVDKVFAGDAQTRAILDATVADLYSIQCEDLAYILTTFPLLDREQPPLPGDLDLDGTPRSYITRDLALLEFFKLRNETPPDDIVSFFSDAGADIAPLTGSIRSLEKRVAAALELGAVAYVPPRPNLRKGRSAEAEDGAEDEDA